MRGNSEKRPLRTVRPLVDWILVFTGPNSFRRYRSLLQKGIGSNHGIIRRCSRSLLTAPTPPGQFFEVSSGSATYEYFGNGKDDLAYVSRYNMLPWEVVSRGLWTELAKSSQRAADIGASTGVYSLTALAVNPNIRVVALEPNPRMVPLLMANVDANGWLDRCAVLSLAASDTTGFIDLGLNSNAGGAGLVSIEKPLEGHGTAWVFTVSLDALITELDLLKIDIEGHEASVFRGMTQLLLSCHPIILAEALDEASLAAQFEVLGPLGYETPICVSEEYPQTGDARNFVWAPMDKRQQVIKSLEFARSQAIQEIEIWSKLFPEVKAGLPRPTRRTAGDLGYSYGA